MNLLLKMRVKYRTRKLLRLFKQVHPELEWSTSRRVLGDNNERVQISFYGRNKMYIRGSKYFFADEQQLARVPLWLLVAVWESTSETLAHELRFDHWKLREK